MVLALSALALVVVTIVQVEFDLSPWGGFLAGTIIGGVGYSAYRSASLRVAT